MSEDNFKRLLEGNFNNNISDITWLVNNGYITYSSNMFGLNAYKIIKPFEWEGLYNHNKRCIICDGPRHGVKAIYE